MTPTQVRLSSLFSIVDRLPAPSDGDHTAPPPISNRLQSCRVSWPERNHPSLYQLITIKGSRTRPNSLGAVINRMNVPVVPRRRRCRRYVLVATMGVYKMLSRPKLLGCNGNGK
jgi:hypothetical protein